MRVREYITPSIYLVVPVGLEMRIVRIYVGYITGQVRLRVQMGVAQYERTNDNVLRPRSFDSEWVG